MPCMKLLRQPTLDEEALHDSGKLECIGRRYIGNVLLKRLWPHVIPIMRGMNLL